MVASAKVLFTEVMIICVIYVAIKSYALRSPSFYLLFLANETLHLVTAKLSKEQFCWQRASDPAWTRSCSSLRYYNLSSSCLWVLCSHSTADGRSVLVLHSHSLHNRGASFPPLQSLINMWLSLVACLPGEAQHKPSV